jgi:Glycosyltransferase WbsX
MLAFAEALLPLREPTQLSDFLALFERTRSRVHRLTNARECYCAQSAKTFVSLLGQCIFKKIAEDLMQKRFTGTTVILAAVACSLGCSPESAILSRPSADSLRVAQTVPVNIDHFNRGIYYFAGWTSYPEGWYTTTEVPHYNNTEWQAIDSFNLANPTESRVPLYSGFADQDQQWIIDQHIQAMAQTGFDYVAYQVGWSHERWFDGAHPAAYFDYAAKRHVASAYRDQLKFALTWSNVQSNDPSYWWRLKDAYWTKERWRDSFSAMVNSWATEFINSSAFYRTYPDGRPVIFIFSPETLEAPNSILPGNVSTTPADMMALLKQIIVSRGLGEPFLVATNVPTSRIAEMATWHFDAISGYLYRPGNVGYDHIMATYAGDTLTETKYGETYPLSYGQWGADLVQIIQNGTSLKYFVPISVDQDGRPTGYPLMNWGVPTAAQFEQHVRQAMRTADRFSARTNQNIIVCCWNEWSEGGFLEPTTRRGSELAGAYHNTIEMWTGPDWP